MRKQSAAAHEQSAKIATVVRTICKSVKLTFIILPADNPGADLLPVLIII